MVLWSIFSWYMYILYSNSMVAMDTRGIYLLNLCAGVQRNLPLQVGALLVLGGGGGGGGGGRELTS